MSSLRLKLRLAVKICDHWSRIPCDPPICPQTWQKTEAAWRLVEEARRRADTASRKCFAGAQESCLAAFRRICSELVRGASALCAGSPVPIRPGLPQLLSELRQIEDDFDDFEIDWHERRVSAYTPIIVLGEVDLGRFRIDLYWERFGSGSPGDCFEAIAEEPNCAAGHSEVCHPHVRGNRACLGDGAHALKSAMTEGRLADSFQVVASVLHTYNPGSAYVDLESWNGEECGDCGCTVSHDDSRWCSNCEVDRCSDCVCCCGVCSDSYCDECITVCADCHESVCSGCAESTQPEEEKCCPRCAQSRRNAAPEVEEAASCVDSPR